nr:PREDICTED: shootin-1-like [Lepisosteus oculatus]
MLPCPSSPMPVKETEGDEEIEAQKVKKEYKRLTEQRDEAERQLKHIKRVSQMVIEEVSVLQTQLEIEKSCRENAEALATKLNCENRKLKYLSLTSRPCLDELLPSISDCIALEEEAEPQDPSPDPFTQYQQQVKDLQETVSVLLEEKKQLTCQLQDQQSQIEELTARIEKDQAEMKELHKTVEQQSKTIKRFNRVSVMAAQEYEDLREQLDLEQSLRQKAESYAHEMLVKQKEANRQSMILLQQADPSLQLLKALEDVASITKTLEDERQQHQQKVKELELELQESALRLKLSEQQKHLELVEEEKREADVRIQQLEEKNSQLESQVQELLDVQKTQPSELGTDLKKRDSLIAIMRKSSKNSKGPLKAEPAPVSGPVDDVKVKAVNEMMERIKHGVVLRPVKGQDTKRFGPKQPQPPEEKQQESAMEELKGILDNVKKSPSRGFPEVAPGKKDSELEVILRRRRKQACDPETGDDKESEMSKVSSSESLNARHSSDSGKEPIASCNEGSVHSSRADRGTGEVVANGCYGSGEDNEKKSATKCAQPNGFSHALPNRDKHGIQTAGSPDGPLPVNGSTDAEC